MSFSDAAGYEKETGHDAVMERVSENGQVIGFIGFTGTPIEKTDANTRAVFGDRHRLRAALGEAQTYKQEIPSLLHYNAVTVISDGLEASLAANNSAVEAMGSDELKVIAAELVTQVRKSVTIDWTVREGARAKIKVMVKRILRKHGYPPDLEDEATKTVLAQAELLCADWAAEARAASNKLQRCVLKMAA